ncbi:FAD-binding and (Fe-S)-binding domain-containing protein [Neolewinella antarctica]|uniref:FAD/FMN-containing dehydrogenase/Fe-S oxidoreductase n=1 Tax=Neolewinella antarctica TaxID=442734 RepID=A0ABX0XAR5_9BACT|nr:FAD-binding and (Fe-S)-binding domain-containing protein [Neolewinella antarctica]NJC26302.1 FAD/FMN-containing dehydrogenase/Fe-S oxidoreductase [Neolewinella antarctica]
MVSERNLAGGLSDLARRLEGDLRTDEAHRILFATDASVYREKPLAVVFPKSEADIISCVEFAGTHNLPITPRAGGTSLAGQAVGAGLVVDVSKYLREIIEINIEESYAIVQPGVIRDQLNEALRPLGYWFGPNTSTANRCTMGGMFGNNSCGSTSITVGATRDHVISARVVLSDGTLYDTGARSQVQGNNRGARMGEIQTYLNDLLRSPKNQQKITEAFPKATVTRRNTGYALDELLRQKSAPYNLIPILAGSEGTLAFTTQLKVRILPLPPPGSALAAVHFTTIDAAMRATQVAMRHRPFMCELMDDTILRLARTNPAQAKNASFVHGDPRALLLVEFRAETDEAALSLAENMAAEIEGGEGDERVKNKEKRFKTENPRPKAADPSPETEDLPTPTAYRLPTTAYLTSPTSVAQAWNLRAAGLGILGNMVGDAKAVACIEDTAVAVADLADYIAEVESLMQRYEQKTVYYAHAGAGEIHLRPVLNLKRTADREAFYHITHDVARLVKKYRGSLSGEHGDGRVRAVFLPEMLGPDVYRLLVDLKRVFDPDNIFNPGKIVHAPPMNEGLRYEADVPTPTFATALDWSADEGLLRAAEKCNGSGDCRKMDGGAMCPSFRATLDEQHGTRGRANTLREVLTRNQHDNPFDHPALAEAMDLCLSCKACTSECPSSVDMTNLKAEYLHQKNKSDLRTKLVAANEPLYRLGSKMPTLANFGIKLMGPLIKKMANIAPERSLPPIATQTLRKWNKIKNKPNKNEYPVNLFCDEFTNLQDVNVGTAAIQLLTKLGYQVNLTPNNAPSGRAHLSKGLLDQARKFAKHNVRQFFDDDRPLIGLEPSAILGFRDEYPKLLRGELQEQATELARRTYTLDEFLFREFSEGRLTPDDFGDQQVQLVLHVHCHEKALGDASKCAAALSLPKNFAVTLLDSGCCGMAGSFGYEAEHYELSKKIAEQSLLRHLRGLGPEVLVVANGTSCRHQVMDLLGLRVLSTAEVLLRSWEE